MRLDGTEVWDAMTALTPMGHLGAPEDIAAGVAYLASDDADLHHRPSSSTSTAASWLADVWVPAGPPYTALERGENMRHGVLASTVATAAGALALTVVTARWTALHWGATTGEVDETLPGDDVVRDAGLVATRAITIDAPPERVWPWVVQIGQGRGGFYSYDWLENLVGCDIHSADEIVEPWQHVVAGRPRCVCTPRWPSQWRRSTRGARSS